MKDNHTGHRKRLKERFGKSPSSIPDYELLELILGYVIRGRDVKGEAKELLKHYNQLDNDGLYNPNNLPFKTFAEIQSNYTGISFGSTNHSADFVELAMFGPGSENLKHFVKNTDLHNFMLQTAGLIVKS